MNRWSAALDPATTHQHAGQPPAAAGACSRPTIGSTRSVHRHHTRTSVQWTASTAVDSEHSPCRYPYPLVVFDLDGTLVDSAADIAEALNRTLEDWQLPRVPEATVLTWIGDGVRRLVEQAVHRGRQRHRSGAR